MDYDLRKLTDKKRDEIIYTLFEETLSNVVIPIVGRKEFIVSSIKKIMGKVKNFDSKVDAYETVCRIYDEVLRDREERFAEVGYYQNAKDELAIAIGIKEK